MWSVPHWQSEKKSVDAVYCCVVFSAAARVLRKPHYEALRLWIVCLGPVSRVAQIPEIWPGRMNFCTLALASYQPTGAMKFWCGGHFFLGGGEFLRLFCCEGTSTPNMAGNSLCHSLSTCIFDAQYGDWFPRRGNPKGMMMVFCRHLFFRLSWRASLTHSSVSKFLGRFACVFAHGTRPSIKMITSIFKLQRTSRVLTKTNNVW